MGICPQQFRTATGLYTNPGCPKNPKRIRHYHRFKSLTHYHPGEHSLVVFLILSIFSALLSCILADIVLVLFDIVVTALASGDCPPKWKADFLVSSTQVNLHETRGSLNVYMLSVLLFLAHYQYDKLKVWVMTGGRSSSLSSRKSRKYRPMKTWCELVASLASFWFAVLNVLLIIIT